MKKIIVPVHDILVGESGASSASGHARHTGNSSLAPLITCRESYRDVTYDVTVYVSTQFL